MTNYIVQTISALDGEPDDFGDYTDIHEAMDAADAIAAYAQVVNVDVPGPNCLGKVVYRNDEQ